MTVWLYNTFVMEWSDTATQGLKFLYPKGHSIIYKHKWDYTFYFNSKKHKIAVRLYIYNKN